jgi:hypothetical protein
VTTTWRTDYAAACEAVARINRHYTTPLATCRQARPGEMVKIVEPKTGIVTIGHAGPMLSGLLRDWFASKHPWHRELMRLRRELMEETT